MKNILHILPQPWLYEQSGSTQLIKESSPSDGRQAGFAYLVTAGTQIYQSQLFTYSNNWEELHTSFYKWLRRKKAWTLNGWERSLPSELNKYFTPVHKQEATSEKIIHDEQWAWREENVAPSCQGSPGEWRNHVVRWVDSETDVSA